MRPAQIKWNSDRRLMADLGVRCPNICRQLFPRSSLPLLGSELEQPPQSGSRSTGSERRGEPRRHDKVMLKFSQSRIL
jgi:hypothetical protein